MTVVIDRPAGALAPAGPAPAGHGAARRAGHRAEHLVVAARAGLLIGALVAFSLVGSLMVRPAAHGHAGPVAADYLPIAAAPAPAAAPRPGPDASTGTYEVHCGRNLDGHRNSDNFITAPGVRDGAHHVHDYVGNTSTDGASTDASLAAAGTTCDRGDRSTYFWPVLRQHERILTPTGVRIQFLGNAQAPVHPMPRFLRVITGDAKAVTHGPGKDRARWSCDGTPGRVSTAHYPLCPAGQAVVRTAEFPSCWNGLDTDSETHRDHVVFPDRLGACPQGTVAVPRLRITLTYAVEPGRTYAIDSFPQEGRKAVTDHFDFVNVMPDALMRAVVDRVNG